MEARRLKRGHVLSELLETERIYVSEMSSILKVSKSINQVYSSTTLLDFNIEEHLTRSEQAGPRQSVIIVSKYVIFCCAE